MDIIGQIKARAKSAGLTIALPEGEEERNVIAAGQVMREGIAKIILLGREKQVRATAARVGTDARLPDGGRGRDLRPVGDRHHAPTLLSEPRGAARQRRRVVEEDLGSGRAARRALVSLPRAARDAG